MPWGALLEWAVGEDKKRARRAARARARARAAAPAVDPAAIPPCHTCGRPVRRRYKEHRRGGWPTRCLECSHSLRLALVARNDAARRARAKAAAAA